MKDQIALLLPMHGVADIAHPFARQDQDELALGVMVPPESRAHIVDMAVKGRIGVLFDDLGLEFPHPNAILSIR